MPSYEYTEDELEYMARFSVEERNEIDRLNNLFHHVTAIEREPAFPLGYCPILAGDTGSKKMNAFVRLKTSKNE